MVPVQTVDLALLFSVNLRRGWRCAILVISAFTAAGFFIPGNAEAFFPWNWRNELGGGGESHQFITTQAVAAVDQELFSVSRPTKPMKKALDEIVNANGGVDDDQFHSKKHFDGENFADGQEWVLSQRQRVIEAIAAENAAGARAALGAALHSIQDFYSHSNWVDTGHNSPSPALGRPGQALAPVAAESVNTCQDCIPHTIPLCNDCTSNVLTNLLTSGYYGG